VATAKTVRTRTELGDRAFSLPRSLPPSFQLIDLHTEFSISPLKVVNNIYKTAVRRCSYLYIRWLAFEGYTTGDI